MKFCSLYSGSSGNSMFIASDNAKVLIDAGLPGKKIDEALLSIGENPRELDGIFITHEHSDHIKGIGVLSRKYDIPIYANADTWCVLEGSIGKIKEHNIKIMDRRSTLSINDLDITSFNIPHDAVAPVGYTLHNRGKKISVITDFGIYTEEIKDNIKDSEIILLESNHDVNMLKFGPYPYVLKRRILSEVGHLSNEDCGKAIVDLINYKPHKRIILGHLSGTNNNADLALETVASILRENNIVEKEDIFLTMADRHSPSNLLEI